MIFLSIITTVLFLCCVALCLFLMYINSKVNRLTTKLDQITTAVENHTNVLEQQMKFNKFISRY